MQHDNQTFTLDRGRTFASGLFWQPLPAAKADRKSFIDLYAAEHKSDLIVVRSSATQQAGFASTEQGYEQGQLSAAAMISKTVEMLGLGANILIAVAVDANRYLFFQQNDGTIAPDGDFIGTSGEVQSRMHKELLNTERSFNRIIAPSHWTLGKEVHEMTLDEFFPAPKSGTNERAYKKWWSLQPIKKSYVTKRMVYLLAAAAVIGLGAAYGINYWKTLQAAKEAERLRQEQEAQLAQQRLHAPVAMPEVVHPWKNKPRATKFAQACLTAWNSLDHISPAGWIFRDAVCTNNNLIVSWSRPVGGRIDWMSEIEPHATFTPDYTTASVIIPAPMTPDPEEQLIPIGDRAKTIFDFASTLDLKLSLETATQPILGTPPGAKQPTLANWKEQKWAFNGLDKPLVSTIAAIDGEGFRIDTIQFAIVNNLLNYTVQGISYGNP